jgi:hypothetical protein
MPVPVIARATPRIAPLGNASRQHAAAPSDMPHGRRLRIAPLALLVALCGGAAMLLVAGCGGAAMLPLAGQAQSLALEAHRASADVALASITLRDAWDGSADAYAELSAQCSAVAAAPARLAAALPRFGNRAERDALQYHVERIAGQIDAWVQDCVRIADLREVVLLGHEVRASLEASMPEQMVLLERVAMRIKQGASADRLYILMRQHVLLERILRSARAVLQAGVEGVTAQDRLHRDTAVYVRTLDALIDGNADLGVQALADADSLADLRAARERFGPVAHQLGVLANDQDIMGAGDSLQELAFARDSLIDDLRALATKVQGEPL